MGWTTDTDGVKEREKEVNVDKERNFREIKFFCVARFEPGQLLSKGECHIAIEAR